MVLAIGTAVGIGLLAYYGARKLPRQPLSTKRERHWLIYGTVAIFLFYAIYTSWKHLTFASHGHDLGIFDQVLWEFSRGETPASTIRKIPVPHIWGDHFHPILLLLVPLYWIWPSAGWLLVAQAIAFAALFPVTFRLAQRFLPSNRLSLFFAGTVALHPGIFLAANFDFHELAFAPVLLIAAVWLAETKRWRWYWVTIAGLLLTKESLGPYVFLLGLHWLLRKQWKAGLATAAAGLVAFFMITRLIIPHYAGGFGFAYWDQYEHLAPSAAALPGELLQRPWRFAVELFNHPDKVDSMKWMFGSFAFLPLLSWTTLPLVGLTLAERYWTSNQGLWLLQFHYQLMMVAVFAVATLYAIRDLTKRWPAVTRFIPMVILFLAGTTLMTHVKVSTGERLYETFGEFRSKAEWDWFDRIIPAAAKVSAQDAFVPHLAHRTTIYQFPRVREADWIVLDPRAPAWPLTSDQIQTWQRLLRVNANWKLVHQAGALTIFKRQSPFNAGLPTKQGWE